MARGGRNSRNKDKEESSGRGGISSRGDRGGREEQKKDFKQIGTIMDKGKGSFIVANNQDYKNKEGKEYKAPGRILFEDFETGKIFELNTISIFDVSDKAPEDILNNIVINLENKKQVVDVTKEFE